MRSSLLLVLALLAPSLARAEADAGARVAVLPVVGDEVAADLRALLEDTVRAEVRRIDDVGPGQVQPTVDTRRHLQGASALGLSCDPRDATCAAELGALCGVRQVVVPIAQPDGDALQLTLVLVDASEARAIAQVEAQVSAHGSELIPGVRGATRALFAPAPAPLGAPLARPSSSAVWWGTAAGLLAGGVTLALGGVATTVFAAPLADAPLGPEERAEDRALAVLGGRVLAWTLYGLAVIAVAGGGAAAGAALYTAE